MTDLDPATVAACAEWLQQAELVDVAADMLAALTPRKPTVREVVAKAVATSGTVNTLIAWANTCNRLSRDHRDVECEYIAQFLRDLSAAYARESAAPSAGPEGDGMGELREAWETLLRYDGIDNKAVAEWIADRRPSLRRLFDAVRALVDRSGGR